jgi:hypothetical protein
MSIISRRVLEKSMTIDPAEAKKLKTIIDGGQ